MIKTTPVPRLKDSITAEQRRRANLPDAGPTVGLGALLEAIGAELRWLSALHPELAPAAYRRQVQARAAALLQQMEQVP